MNDCYVSQIKTLETDGYTAVQLATEDKKLKHVTRPLLKHFQNAGVEPKRVVREFRVSADDQLSQYPLGQPIPITHFTAGQTVDIRGTSKGKGFQGGMKRWGFHGLRASHGVSVSHRSLGSTGANQDPGKVWKGKKMAGRMGGDTVTVSSVRVYAVDTKEKLLLLRGSIPGPKGGLLEIRDAVIRGKGPKTMAEGTFVPLKE